MHLINKQAYKFAFSKNLKIYNIFYILLLKKDIIKKKQIDKNNIIKLDVGNINKKNYKIKTI